MEFKTKKLSDVSVELAVKNTAAEVQEAYRAVYRKAQAKMKLPGFRVGKAPLELIERNLGESVAEDALRELIASSFSQIVEKLDPAPISAPRFEVESFDRQKGAAYKGAYESMPKVKLAKYRKLKIQEDRVAIAEKDIEEELERMRKERGHLVSREDGARLEDYATLRIAVTHGGENLYNNDELRARLGAGNTLPGVDDQIVGMKSGEKRQFEVQIESDFGDPRFAGKLLQVDVELLDLQQIELPELNDEFARDLGEFNTLADLKTKIRNSLESEGQQALKQKAAQQALDQLVSETKLPLPETLIEQELESRTEQLRQRLGNKELSLDDIARLAGQPAEGFRQDMRNSAEKTVRERLVLRELIEAEELAIQPAEVEAEIRQRYGALLPENQLPQLLANENLREEVEGRLLFRKAMDYLYTQADRKNGAQISLAQMREQGLLREHR